ncbi:unnamed protein product [Callosobruchus maculatus]|uniref:Uncharacterized protein n=1 Tax=Callosobruchus maculatus TaxID=64391 RepID=A0A653C4N9_CALMS|nr:unnamed protein product [Callosobruchus maculatus]
MSDKSVFLTLSSVFKYLCANTDSRCITEGEEILNANHIILMGVVSDSEEYVELSSIASLEILSSTDVKCYWSYKKKAVEEQ